MTKTCRLRDGAGQSFAGIARCSRGRKNAADNSSRNHLLEKNQERIAAGLLLKTFWNLMQVNPGFDSHHLLAGSFRLPTPNDPKADEYLNTDQRTHLVRESMRRLHGVAGVEHAAFTSVVPLNVPVVPRGYRVEGVSDTGDAPQRAFFGVAPTRLDVESAILETFVSMGGRRLHHG